MNTLKKTFIAVIFLAMILPGAAMWWLPEQSISMGERRALAKAPSLTFDKRLLSQFPQEFESYLNDHFGYRDELIRLHNLTRVKGQLVTELANVIVGSSGWLFFGDYLAIRDMRNVRPYGPAHLGEWAHVLNQKHAWLEQNGIQYLFSFAPSKHLMYPEHLPDKLKIVPRESRLDQLTKHLNKWSSAPILDLRSRLFLEKQRADAKQKRLYYRTDTHWNYFGAYIAYRELIDSLNNLGLTITPLELDDNAFIEARGAGDLAGNLALEKELADLQITFREELATCARYEGIDRHASLIEKHRNWFGTSCEGRPYRVLMLRDSYSLAMMPYLSETFGYIMYVPHSPAPLSAIKKLVEIHKPDIVIEQRASRWLETPNG